MEEEHEIPTLLTGSIALHEFYTSLRDAGFRRMEALWLTACTMTGGPPPVKDKA